MMIRRCALLTLLLLSACGDARADSCTGLRAQLAERLSQARLKGHWSADLPGAETYVEGLEAIPWRLANESLPLNDLDFISGAPSVLIPDCKGECRECIHRKFLLDDDTLSFSLARVPEECSETPRVFWRSPSGDQHEEQLVPLFNWNVDALWCIPHYVVFGLHADNEGTLAGDALVLWNLQTGTWLYAPSGEQYGSYFTGMSLPALFPSWPEIDLAEVGDAIVLRGNGRFVALWPTKREWAILDPASGAAVAGRRVSTRAGMSGPLREAIHAAMLRTDPHAATPEVMEVMSPACLTDSTVSAVLARASTTSPAGDLFAVILADRALTRLISSLEIFPSLRKGDYNALFMPNAAADSIIVIGLGDTYGDQMLVHRFGCGPGSPH
jgi:hypothetical protein